MGGKAVLWCQCRTLDRYHRHTDHGSVQGVSGCCPRTTADGFLDRALVQCTCLRQCTPLHCSVLSVPLNAYQEGERGLVRSVGASSWRAAMTMMMIYNRE